MTNSKNRRIVPPSPLVALLDAARVYDNAGGELPLQEAARQYARSPRRQQERELALLRWLGSVLRDVNTGKVVAWQVAKKAEDGRYHVATLSADRIPFVATGDSLAEAIELHERMTTGVLVTPRKRDALGEP